MAHQKALSDPGISRFLTPSLPAASVLQGPGLTRGGDNLLALGFCRSLTCPAAAT